MATKSMKRFKHGARMWQTTDRQTTLRRNAERFHQKRRRRSLISMSCS